MEGTRNLNSNKIILQEQQPIKKINKIDFTDKKFKD